MNGRLYWQCRRGMRELDLLLQGFLRAGYGELSEPDRARFEELLKESDQRLLEWLMGRQNPVDRDVARIVERIRGAAAP